MWEKAVHDIEREWDEEAKEVCCRNPLVAGADGEQLRRHGPGDGEGVELLDLRARPDVGSFDGLENGRLVFDDARNTLDQVLMGRRISNLRDHHHIVEKSTKDATK
jgi:hypothetical protein